MVPARSGSLSPAQQDGWFSLYWREQHGRRRVWQETWSIEPALPGETARAVLSELATHHEILRTTFELGPDRRPVQLVWDPAHFTVPISLVGPDSLLAVPDTDRDWNLIGGAMSRLPLWHAIVVLRNGEAHAVRLVFDHIVTDGQGLDEWKRQFLALCHGWSSHNHHAQPLDRPPPPPPDPVRVAALAPRRAPQALVPVELAACKGDDFYDTEIELRDALPLVDRIRRAASVSRHTVLAFVFGWFLSQYSGVDPVLLAECVTPRRRRRGSIDCETVNLFTVFELDRRTTFRTALKTKSAQSLTAYRCSHVCGMGWVQAYAPLIRERGLGALAPTYFDFIDWEHAEPTSRAPGAAQVAVKTVNAPAMDDPLAPVLIASAVGRDLNLHFLSHSSVVPVHVAERLGALFLGLLERMDEGIDASVGSGEDCFLPELRHSHTAMFVRDSWLELGTVEALVAGLEFVGESTVSWDGALLTAHVSLQPGYTPFDVHEFVLGQLHAYRNIRAPDRYIWMDAVVWDPRVDRPCLTPRTDAERALCDAVGSVHGFEAGDTAKTFLEAGGQLLLAPAVVERLRADGWAGLRRCHFSGPFTLRSVARRLTRTARVRL